MNLLGNKTKEGESPVIETNLPYFISVLEYVRTRIA